MGEFSSKETLEWAWNRWTRDEEEFCSLVCETNDLELLKMGKRDKTVPMGFIDILGSRE